MSRAAPYRIVPAFLSLLVVLLTLWSAPLSAQPLDQAPVRPDAAYWRSYLTAGAGIVTAPVHWTGKQWLTAGGVAVVATVAYIYDDPIREFFQRQHSPAVDGISSVVFEPWGRGIYPAALLGSLYLVGVAGQHGRLRQTALGGAQAWIMSAATVQVIKHLTHRHRPYQDSPPDPRAWEGPFHGFEYTSFPSGHTITAFALASFLSSAWSDEPWVGYVSYSLAAGVGLSRIYDDKHWASDVIVGAALGVAIGRLVFRINDQPKRLSLGISQQGMPALVYHLGQPSNRKIPSSY